MTKPRALLSLTSSLLLASVLALGCKKEAPPEPPPAPPPPPAEVKAAEPVKAPEPAKAAEPDATPAKPAEPAAAPAAGKGALLSPKSMTEEAPAKYKVKFTTSKGEFVIEVQRDHELVTSAKGRKSLASAVTSSAVARSL